MLFMITQVHTPDNCAREEGGAEILFDRNAEGVALKGRWGAWAHHTIWYLVEADDLDAIQRFVGPGMKRCTCTVAPVSENPPAP
jgi:hypothetical protein